jgi:serine protease Do
MKRFSILLLLSFLCAIPGLQAQNNIKGLQKSIHSSFKRAYAASVRIWAFDTVRNARTGPQFTGVVVTPTGHILTAAHVNTPGTTYKVMFPDGRSTIAVGRGEIELEAKTFMPDVAMLKIVNEVGWPFAQMGHSAKLTKGMFSISIAYPETLDQPLPMLRVGEIYDTHNEYGFLQSTCLMEPGDSGGPLFDALGNVIGIHSAVDISEKANFEVPVDLYRTYWSALQQTKTYSDYPVLKDSIAYDSLQGPLAIFPELDKLDQSVKIVPKMMKSTVFINSMVMGKPQQIVGALIAAKGVMDISSATSLVVSKSSYVGEDVAVSKAGKSFKAKVLARDKANDLVLLAIDGKVKGGLDLSRVDTADISIDAIGTFLISPIQPNQHRVSVLGTQLFGLPKSESMGYLGAQIAYFGPLIVTSVSQDFSTNEFFFQKDDELLTINGVKLSKRADFLKESGKYWPGDTVTVMLKRSEKIITSKIVLSSKPIVSGVHQAELFEGGKSRRRDGYASVFAHDARLKPEECGGAVFDVKGHFYGINIGRSSRVSNLVIPASVVLRFAKLSRP